MPIVTQRPWLSFRPLTSSGVVDRQSFAGLGAIAGPCVGKEFPAYGYGVDEMMTNATQHTPRNRSVPPFIEGGLGGFRR